MITAHCVVVCVFSASTREFFLRLAKPDVCVCRTVLLCTGHPHLLAVQLESQDQQHSTPAPLSQPRFVSPTAAVE